MKRILGVLLGILLLGTMAFGDQYEDPYQWNTGRNRYGSGIMQEKKETEEEKIQERLNKIQSVHGIDRMIVGFSACRLIKLEEAYRFRLNWHKYERVYFERSSEEITAIYSANCSIGYRRVGSSDLMPPVNPGDLVTVVIGFAPDTTVDFMKAHEGKYVSVNEWDGDVNVIEAFDPQTSRRAFLGSWRYSTQGEIDAAKPASKKTGNPLRDFLRAITGF